MDIFTELLDRKRAKQLHSYHTSGGGNDDLKVYEWVDLEQSRSAQMAGFRQSVHRQKLTPTSRLIQIFKRRLRALFQSLKR